MDFKPGQAILTVSGFLKLVICLMYLPVHHPSVSYAGWHRNGLSRSDSQARFLASFTPGTKDGQALVNIFQSFLSKSYAIPFNFSAHGFFHSSFPNSASPHLTRTN